MKAHANMVKSKATSRGSNQQAIFELKQRVALALNKLADRDTYQLGVEELEKTIECLTPDGVAPFLSCILDTNFEKKSAVRKECIRLMGTLATFHEGLIGSHLGKITASIVKRLKESDSVVRDACAETVGVLASKLSSGRMESDSVFITLVRPLFEALGEQNKHMQTGSAMCLSQIIDNIHDPPPLVLQKMLARTIKFLKNPHFMAKPAVIELNRSIILAGGTPSHGSLTAALTSIQESLKNSDWTTRKAACTALGDIASFGAACLGSYRSSCIHSLEACRFDKVKPVRDIALQALQLWKSLGSNTAEPSEAGSSVKDTSYRDDYTDVTSACDSTLKDNTLMKFGNGVTKRKVPLSTRKAGRTCIEKPQLSGRTDWKIEIAVPKSCNISAAENPNEESDCSSVIKRCERINSESDARSISNIGYEYVEVDGKQEYSSVSDLFTESIKSEVVAAHCDAFDHASLVKSTGTSRRFAVDDVSAEEQRYSARVQDRRSLDSTITETTSQTMHGCCAQTEKEITLIRKHLFDIENKQSNLIDMLKEFTTSVMDSVSTVQMKVSNLELVVDKMAEELVHGGRYSDVLAAKLMKRSPSIASPRLSTCTPRTSVDSSRHSTLLPTKQAPAWEDTFTRNRTNNAGRTNSGMWADATLKPGKVFLGKKTPASYSPDIHEEQTRKTGGYDPKARLNKMETTKNSPWKAVKDYFCNGDLDSAYAEALSSRNEQLLFELLDRTGPSLENLSKKTANDLLSNLALYLMDQRFVSFIIPWLQQLVDLSNIHGPAYLVPSSKTKQELLYGIQEAAKLDIFNPGERRCISEIGKMLCHCWG